jgi:monofunctional biosynthetic peptidoglycan transglycosylase
MQTSKNVFLWPGRDWVRKAFEAYFTVLIEIAWGKQRIMEVYLNLVEWGPGIYGAEAAARHYFHKPAAALTIGEAVRICRLSPRAVPALPAERSARGRATGGSHSLRTRRPAGRWPAWRGCARS